MTVLAIGATGQFAGLVVPALVARGLQVRALVHDPDKADQALAAGASDWVQADLRDPQAMREAMDGTEGVYLILPAFASDASEIGTAAVATAANAGVRRVVFSGVYHPSLSLVNHADTRPIEEALYHSDLQFTVLQPAMYLQGLTAGLQQALTTGTFAMPYSKHSQMTFVDFRDVAEVAAIALVTDTLEYGTFELAAGGMASREDIAALLSRASGRTVEAVDIDPGQAVGDADDFQARGLAAMFADYSAHGFHGGNSLVLQTILGRAPRSLEAFITEFVADQT